MRSLLPQKDQAVLKGLYTFLQAGACFGAAGVATGEAAAAAGATTMAEAALLLLQALLPLLVRLLRSCTSGPRTCIHIFLYFAHSCAMARFSPHWATSQDIGVGGRTAVYCSIDAAIGEA